MSMSFRASPDVIIRTESFDAAVQFYETVLGLPVASRSETLVGFEAGALRLYVEKGVAHGPVLDMHVADFEVAREALLSAGCSIVEENRAVPKCYLRDPYGLVFNIDQRRGDMAT
jgi:catechol 2,3-dioxygenase-like lactoylglutathione lyase family enzyme